MGAVVAQHVGARKVVITDIREYRLELAKKVGIQYCINTNHQSLKNVIHEIGMKEGFDVGLEMYGSSQAFNSIPGSMRAGGKIALLGILPPQTIISWDLIIF
jgi:threonine 3-dehydrogenase